jgi:ferredoxin-like protein FixX
MLPHKVLTMMLSIALFLCLLTGTAGQDLLTLNVYAVNAPSNALTTVAANASAYYSVLLDAEPSNYIWLDPGEAIPESRKLERAEGESAEAKPSAAVSTTSSLRGPESRRLLSSCPTTCAKSSSSSCKQTGCAYCGTSCRRRVRKLLLSSVAAATVEASINLLLLPLCGIRLGCSIYSKIYRVSWVNGTAVQTALV